MDDWAEWKGGDVSQPVGDDVLVKYKLRSAPNKERGPELAKTLDWRIKGRPWDIMSFCVPTKPWVPGKSWEETMKFANLSFKQRDVWEVKDTNPKDVAGSARIDMTLVSDIACAEEALAMEEGAAKYGAYNYRVAGVKARVYVGAARRHLAKWLNGEDRDPKTGVHHLGSVRACVGILLDAEALGKLVDDRPPANHAASAQLDGLEARVRKVRKEFESFHPHHFTEAERHGPREQVYPANTQAPIKISVPGEDAQPLSARDPGRMVQRDWRRPLDRVQVAESPEEWGDCPRADATAAEMDYWTT